MATWTTVKTKKELPAASGVYVIREGDRCLYVGKAKHIRNRFYLHQIEVGRIAYKDVKFDREKLTFSYTLLPVEDLKVEEMYYIGLFNPELNVQRR